jgi:methylenetetrahydrofolate--tRNA-(uracil-5-)-methyltransferase
LLNPTLEMKAHPHVMFAGQICGVEGYVESIAAGLLTGMTAAARARDEEPLPPPRETALGSLVNYITHASGKNFQPANVTFDLLLPLDEKVRDRALRHQRQCEHALRALDQWLQEYARRESEAGIITK